MLGFDAVGRLALGQVRRTTTVAHSKTVTANVDAGAFVLKQAGLPKAALVDAGPTVLKAVAIAKAAGADALGTVLKAVTKVPFVAGVDLTGAVSTPINRVITLTANVAVSIFDFIAFAGNIVSTRVLQKPVDYFMANLPQYRETGRTYEPGYGKAGEKTTVTRSRRGRISGPAPSSTTTTNKRGYE